MRMKAWSLRGILLQEALWLFRRRRLVAGVLYSLSRENILQLPLPRSLLNGSIVSTSSLSRGVKRQIGERGDPCYWRGPKRLHVLQIQAEGSRQLTFQVLAPCLISLCEVTRFPVYFLHYIFLHLSIPCLRREKREVLNDLENDLSSPRRVSSVYSQPS